VPYGTLAVCDKLPVIFNPPSSAKIAMLLNSDKLSVYMSFINRIFQVWYYIFGFIVGITLFYFGKSRISMGISSIRISDQYTAHFMNVGLLYIQISLLILIALTIGITYSLTKSKK